ncbi:MAG: hypothetical protein KIT84_34600 [Labilithrix sp.]|nr:hypothetical protein [Labilithrix sp.]MCW5816179.1 hypothetical protein [Labilithrix sp.]
MKRLLLLLALVAACSGGRDTTTAKNVSSLDHDKLVCKVDEGPLSAAFLRPEQRADLELALRDGIALVHLDGCNLALVGGCRVATHYEEKTEAPVDDAIEVRSRRDLARVLDADRAAIAMDRHHGVEIHTRTVKQLEVDGANVGSAALTGSSCDRVTHAVRKVSFGAFVVTAPGAGGMSAPEDKVIAAERDGVVAVELKPLGGRGGEMKQGPQQTGIIAPH